MLNNKGIISDAGSLIAFSKINYLPLLFNLFDHVIVTKAVAHECIFDLSRPGAKGIIHAIDEKRIKVVSDNLIDMPLNQIIDILGEGEASAIKLALKYRTLLLIDERQGRNIAKKLQLRIIGTAGILLLAKKEKLIKKIYPIIENLQNSGYRLSKELIHEILKLSKESK